MAGGCGGDAGGLRAALAPGGEMVLETTPNGAYGCFYEEWMKAGACESGRGSGAALSFRGGWSRLMWRLRLRVARRRSWG